MELPHESYNGLSELGRRNLADPSNRLGIIFVPGADLNPGFLREPKTISVSSDARRVVHGPVTLHS